MLANRKQWIQTKNEVEYKLTRKSIRLYIYYCTAEDITYLIGDLFYPLGVGERFLFKQSWLHGPIDENW